jgi:hypothetical protein
METVGQKEVQRVYHKYRIRPVPLLGEFYSLAVQLRSAWYLRRGEHYPGLPPGSGFDLGDYWAHQLVK